MFIQKYRAMFFQPPLFQTLKVLKKKPAPVYLRATDNLSLVKSSVNVSCYSTMRFPRHDANHSVLRKVIEASKTGYR